jgi:hypothetical protein
MTDTPSSPKQSEELSVYIRLSQDDGELLQFLRTRGVKASPNYGVFNSAVGPEDLKKMLEHPAPYIIAYALANLIKEAFRAYAETHKRRIVVRKTKTGVTGVL